MSGLGLGLGLVVMIASAAEEVGDAGGELEKGHRIAQVAAMQLTLEMMQCDREFVSMASTTHVGIRLDKIS